MNKPVFLDFDPFILLNLQNMPEDEKTKLKPVLMEKIAEFILLKTAQKYPQRVNQADNLQTLLSTIDKNELNGHLDAFKSQFRQTYDQ